MDIKLLLIDDDSDDREMFCEAVQSMDQTVTCFTETNGRKAMEKLDSRKIENPDVIFLDVNMPLMNGWECLRALKSNDTYKEIKVMMYSTSAEIEDVNKAKKLGAIGFLKKPTDFNALKESLEVIINHVKGAALQPSKLISL